MFDFLKKQKKMIDMHCHILPGLDDGSPDMEETLEMLKIAAKDGIEAMIVTPHFKNGRRNAGVPTIKKRIEEVTEVARDNGIDIKLYPGNEIFYFDEMGERLDDGSALTLNETNSVLIEFHPSDEYKYIRNALDDVISLGYDPIIAHIERYGCMVRKPFRAKELKDMGVEIQINAHSIEGMLGKEIQKFTFGLLNDRLVDYVGTDAHDKTKRIPELQNAYKLLSKKKYDEKYLDDIFHNNAMAIIDAE